MHDESRPRTPQTPQKSYTGCGVWESAHLEPFVFVLFGGMTYESEMQEGNFSKKNA